MVSKPAQTWSQTSSLESPHDCAQMKRKREKIPKLDGDSSGASWGSLSGQVLPVSMTIAQAFQKVLRLLLQSCCPPSRDPVALMGALPSGCGAVPQ